MAMAVMLIADTNATDEIHPVTIEIGTIATHSSTPTR